MDIKTPYVIVLGTAQDAGYPHAGCKKECCKRAWEDASARRMASCIALVEPETDSRWIFDATPDFKEQLHKLDKATHTGKGLNLSGIFLTHGHIGHYTGLMHLGREAMNTKNIKVFSMRGMSKLVKENAPWSQLTELGNIELTPLSDNAPVALNKRLSMTPFLVPHRSEYTETVGFKISGPEKSLVYIPDIDSWAKWDRDIREVIKENDFALIDGTFYDKDELPGANIDKIPHPFIADSMELFAGLSPEEKSRIYFTHLNHSNPLLNRDSEKFKEFKKSGFKLATEMQVMEL